MIINILFVIDRMSTIRLDDFNEIFENIDTKPTNPINRNLMNENKKYKEENENQKKEIERLKKQNDELSYELVRLRMFKLMHDKLKEQN